MSIRKKLFNRNDVSEDSAPQVNESQIKGNVFLKAVVREVISNPIDYFSRNATDNDGNEVSGVTVEDVETTTVRGNSNISKKFANSEAVSFVVQNSISATLVKDFKNTGSIPSAYLCMPFFPQHLSLPVKPGEYVWVYRAADGMYYWLCRISTVRQVDDVNFTHLPRSGVVEKNHKKTKDQSLFYNFAPVPGVAAAPGKLFDNIAKNSIAYREEFTGEVVPRMAKDCSDLLIQGSNNAHILLGKEKFEDASTTIAPEEMTPHENSDVNENRKPLSPAIDICVLRKARELFDLKNNIASDKSSVIAETFEGEAHSGEGSGLSAVAGRGTKERAGLRYFELEKARESLDPNVTEEIFTQEFIDSDIYNCIARIYMTNAKTIDDLLFIPSLEGENSSAPQDVLGLGNYGAMVALGANTRLIGTETVKIQNIVGSSGIQFTPQGDVIIHANRDGGAKIVLEAAGDIRIIPGDLGIVKIGGEDADTVPVGGSSGTFSTMPGQLTYAPIATTAGGELIDPSDIANAEPLPGVANYSKKCLIK